MIRLEVTQLRAYDRNPRRCQNSEYERIQVGADADLVVFDLDEIRVNASLQNPLPHSTGMRYVIVNGTPVIAEGELDLSAKPGRPIRREAK